MEVLHPRCCGLDVHEKTVVACTLVSGAGEARPQKAVRTFSTMPADLRALEAWLAEQGISHVAMESTGIYWKPIWNVLEGRFSLLLVNPGHVKAVPGRKTDVRDAEWLADLLRHGLLRGSFVPDRAQQDLRDLTRLRTTRTQARAAEINRLQATLEKAGLKLGAVVSDVTGVSARAMLAAILAGETDAAAMAALAKGKLRAKQADLEAALAAIPDAHYRFLIAEHLAMLDDLDAVIARLDTLIAAKLADRQDDLDRLDTIPGIDRRVAEGLVAEVGTDVTQWPTAKHLASWAGLCPGHDESAGKRRGGKTRPGNRWLRSLLCQAAQAVGRSRGTYLGAQYHRLVPKRGKGKATIAVAHSILIRAYCLLRDGTTYTEPGADWFDRRQPAATEHRLVKRLERLGFRVHLEPLAATPAPIPAGASS
jgi:transposase